MIHEHTFRETQCIINTGFNRKIPLDFLLDKNHWFKATTISYIDVYQTCVK